MEYTINILRVRKEIWMDDLIKCAANGNREAIHTCMDHIVELKLAIDIIEKYSKATTFEKVYNIGNFDG